MKVWKLFENRGLPHLNTEASFIAGMECEIESVSSRHDIGVWNATTDGSLRNHGIEFISPPMQKDALLESFSHLHQHIEYVNPMECFSQRTSIHVHVNCRSLEDKQVKNMLLLYALFEPFFFSLVEPQRRDNIHCVALTDTYLPGTYHFDLNGLAHGWHKYTAFNILPLRTLGTVEFRHMQGTGDFELVTQWLTLLENLYTLCQRTSVDSETLSQPINLKMWWRHLFGHCPQIMAMEPEFHTTIENSLIDVKLAFA